MSITLSAIAESQKRTRKFGDSAEADLEVAKLERQQEEAALATKRYKQLLKVRAKEQAIIEEFADVTRDALESGRLRIDIPKVKARKSTPQTVEDAVLVVSDSHIWKIVNADHTLGFGRYNPKIFLDRLLHLEQTVSHLIRENIDNPIGTLNVLFLGDLVEGMLNHSEEIPERGYVVDQVLLASLAFYQFLARLSRVVPIVCRGVVGNHGRHPNQRRMPTAGRYSNLDFIVMGQIKSLIDQAGPENVRFILDEAPFQVFDIKGWRFKIGHGDHLKGGDRALGVPAHAIGREINATTQRYAARGERPPDYYVVGDKHRHMSIQTARGRYMVNSAWFEADTYAMAENFTPGRPHQLFFGIHPKIGKSWSYDIVLDIAKPVPIGYDLPERLLSKVEEWA